MTKAIFKSPLSRIQAHLGSNHLTFKGGGGRKTLHKKFRKKNSGPKGRHKKIPGMPQEALSHSENCFRSPETAFCSPKSAFRTP